MEIDRDQYSGQSGLEKNGGSNYPDAFAQMGLQRRFAQSGNAELISETIVRTRKHRVLRRILKAAGIVVILIVAIIWLASIVIMPRII